MKQVLSAAEGAVLSAMQMDWRLDVPALARATCLRPHVVVYALKRLRERKIMRPFLMCNIHAVGLTDYCCFFNVQGAGKRIRDRVLQYAVESPQTAYVAELSGRYQYSASIMAHSIFEVEAFFQGLTQKIERASLDLSFCIRAQWSVLPIKYLDRCAAQLAPLSRTNTHPQTEVDAVDDKILFQLSRDASISWVKLAAQLGIPYSTVRYRIESLVERGIIIGFPFVIDGARIGRHPFRVLIVARGIDGEFRRELFNFAIKHPCCTMFVRCLGAWDFELNFDLAELAHGGEVVQELYDNFGPCIQATTTVNELAVIKAHTWPMSAPSAAVNRRRARLNRERS